MHGRDTEEWEKIERQRRAKKRQSRSMSERYAIYTSIYVNFIDRSDTMVVTYCCIYVYLCMIMDEFECLCVCTFIRSCRSIHKHIPFIFGGPNSRCCIHFFVLAHKYKWYRILEMIMMMMVLVVRYRLGLCLYEFEHTHHYTELECPKTFRRKSFGIVVNLFCMHTCECVCVCVCSYVSDVLLCAICRSLFASLPIGIIVTCCSIWFNTCD